MEKKLQYIRYGLAIAAFATLLWGFRALILHNAPFMFRAAEEDMSYAWYVPLFSLYVLWTERKEFISSIGRPDWRAIVPMLLFMVVGFIGARGIQVRFEILAFVGMIITLTWALFGIYSMKRVLFPALFLLFCIPLNSFLDIVTVHLRILASSTAYAVLKGFGADIIRTGTMVGAADGSFAIDIAEPCSGLRSIFALMALTAAYAYFNQPTWLRRGLLFLTSVPLAVLGNVMRIITICLVANFASSEFATGFYHDYSGYVVFIVAIVLMIAVGEAISAVAKRLAPKGEPSRPEGDAAREGSDPSHGGLIVPVIVLALLVPAMIYQATTPEVKIAEAPEVHLGEMPGYSWTSLEPSEAELTVLPSDTKIEKRLYTADDGDWFQVSIVTSGTRRGSIHRPELCLPSQGYLMLNPHTISVGDSRWRVITVNANDGGTIGFAYTFFNQEGFKTASHMGRIFRDMWDRSVLNRVDRWIMVTINAAKADDASLSRFISSLNLAK